MSAIRNKQTTLFCDKNLKQKIDILREVEGRSAIDELRFLVNSRMKELKLEGCKKC